MSDEARQHWIAADLDGTLFSRAQTEGGIPATWRGDEPSSWMPAPRHALFAGLAQLFRIVVVTARDQDSFSRVNITSVPLRDGAVISNGAIILKPGCMTADPAWDAEIEPQLADWSARLNEMCAWLAERSTGVARARLVASNTRHPAYLVAKAHDGFWSSSQGSDLREGLAPFGCRVTEHGLELQVLPPPIAKKLGVLYFARTYCDGQLPLMGLGDMPEDLGFMGTAEFLAAPAASKLGGRWLDGH